MWFTDLGSLPYSAHWGYEKHKERNYLVHNKYLTGTGTESILSAPACELWRMKAQNTCHVDFINDHETNQWRFWHKKFVLLWRQLNYSTCNFCWRFAVTKRSQRKPCWSWNQKPVQYHMTFGYDGKSLSLLGRRKSLSSNISSCNHEKEIQTYLSLLHDTGREGEREKERWEKKEENYPSCCQIVLKGFATVVSRVWLSVKRML